MASELDDELKMKQVRERFDTAYSFDRINREEALEDLKFRAGEQWPEEVKRERKDAGRPTLTINRMGQFVNQVIGDIRQNRPSIKVRPVDSGTDPDVAEVFTGIIRHIEQSSDAQAAYVTAADHAATAGMGAFRVLTEYRDDSFDQDIVIKRIKNPFAVYWDPNAQEADRSDAKYCFVSERMGLEEFKAEYPDASLSDFEPDAEHEDWLSNWWNGETVRIAEYWCIEKETVTLYQMEDGSVVDDLPEFAFPVNERKATRNKVVWYKVNGVEVLEGPTEWAGKHIPVVPVVGEEIHIGERVVRHGIVRFAKDPQRLYNYWRTTGAETIALAPKAPWLVTPQMIEGQKAAWEAANVGNPPYLLFNPDSTGLTPKREPPPYPPVAMYQESEIAAEDMKAVTGIYDASLGAQGNETSGRAIIARQREGDTGTYVYIDNLSRSIRRAGEILVDLIPKIYDGDRVIRILGDDETEGFVRLNAPTNDGKYATMMTNRKGETVYGPTLDAGRYDVEVVTGPSYATKRMEAADSIMAFVQAVPQAGALVSDLIAKNMDWPGADQIAERLKRTLPPGIADEDEELSPEEMARRQQAQQQQAMAQQIQMAMAQAEIEKARAEVMKMQAGAAKDGASVAKTQAETEGQAIENAQKALELSMQNGALDALVNRIVRDQVTRILSSAGGFAT